MDRKKTKLLPFTVWALFFIFAAAGLVTFSLGSAKAKEKPMDPNKSAWEEEKKETAAEQEQQQKMNKCMNMCVENCQSNMEDISGAQAAIKVAIDNIDKGDTVAAKNELEKAEKILARVHENMRENIAKMPCANVKCPIEVAPIDRMNTPMEQTRMYKGMKIGFCCSACPAAWDKLTNDEKEGKLKECMPGKD